MPHELAQLNIARQLAALESPQMADFVNNLDRINALAESSPGFVWRLKDETGNATEYDHFGPDVIVNMSVWRDVASLHQFAYHSDHVAILRRRREWFERASEANAVLWWVPAGHRPSLQEADERLQQLRQHGPCVEAFSFRHAFPPPDEAGAMSEFDDTCPVL